MEFSGICGGGRGGGDASVKPISGTTDGRRSGIVGSSILVSDCSDGGTLSVCSAIARLWPSSSSSSAAITAVGGGPAGISHSPGEFDSEPTAVLACVDGGGGGGVSLTVPSCRLAGDSTASATVCRSSAAVRPPPALILSAGPPADFFRRTADGKPVGGLELLTAAAAAEYPDVFPTSGMFSLCDGPKPFLTGN